MLLRIENRIKLFEASYTEGVCVYGWEEANFHLFSPVVYRHLKFNRAPDEIQRLQEFAKEVDGLKYEINPKYILGVKKKKCKGYFCSELIVEAYKRIGLVPEKTRSYLYWPGEFASNFILENDAHFEEEILIDIGLVY
jgi:hypothetical protein